MGAEHDVDPALVAAGAGDEAAFTALAERHRRELRVHCYRMLGSLDDAEDLVQETFLRAWQHRGDVRGEHGAASLRAWLYRIATNACLDALAGRKRRLLPPQVTGPSAPADPPRPRTDIGWLQPFPDRLAGPVEPAGPGGPAEPAGSQPEAVAESRETLELAFLAAMQYLPPRQRAVLILRDVLGWPARQVADLLDASVPATTSALQRARATMREHLPARRADWAAPAEITAGQRAVLRRYVDAVQRADLAAIAELLAADVRAAMPPFLAWFQGRDAVMATLRASWDPDSPAYVGRFRMLPTAANQRPAVAGYLRGPGEVDFHAFAVSVLRVDGGRIAEITAFHDPGLFRWFSLPDVLPG